MDNPNISGDITLTERDYELMSAAGRWAGLLSITGAILVSLLFASLVLVGYGLNEATSLFDPDPGSGYRIKKKFFLDADLVGVLLLLLIYLYWLVLFFVLFRFSAAAKAVNLQRNPTEFTHATLLLSRFFQLLVAGTAVVILLIILPTMLTF